jgi:putative ABC transport system permease protein
MIRNYLKVAWRNLTRSKVASIINITGLAVGIAVAVLNGLWVWDELSFNKMHDNYDRIAKVTHKGINDEGKLYANTSLQYPVGGELKSRYSQYFDHIVIAAEDYDCIVRSGESTLMQKGMFLEPAGPDMLSLKMLKGTRSGLKEQASIMLSASAAKSFFGNEDPINRVVTINTKMDAKVIGVYADIPRNSEFYGMQFFAPFDLWTSANKWVLEQGWDNYFLQAFVQLKKGMGMEEVSAIIKNAEYNITKDLPGMDKEDLAERLWLLPMSNWHLHEDLSSNNAVQMVWMIGLIGFFVLLLACINFMNLSTARSEKRAREVGIRKTIGSSRVELIRQFFGESFLVVLLAFIVGMGLVTLFIPGFNRLSDKMIALPFDNLYFWMAAFICILFTSLVAGSYPALYLSSFKPVKVLKGTFRAGRWASTPRKVLVVVQFTVSVVLIISTIVISQQVQHVKDRPVGYNRNNLLMIEKKTGEFYKNADLIQAELKKTGVVESVADSRGPTTNITMWNRGFFIDGKEVEIPRGCGTLSVSSEYGKTIGWQFVSGRDFSGQLTSDSAAFVVNETFVKLTGIPNPVGKYMTWSPGWRKPKTFTIIGVIKDMVMESPYEPAVPTVYFMEGEYANWINIRLRAGSGIASSLTKIGAVFKKLTPSAPFTYEFADQSYAIKFAAEDRIGKLANLFAGLAIFISCLGLFGLATFIAEQRTREIGIRKVVGASVFSLWRLLSKEFVLLALIAFCIAAPVAYYFLYQWLQNYQYRTELHWWMFVVAAGGMLVITLLTVSYQAIRSAVANPVKSLRTE